ncbi:PAS domain S-box protein [Fulvivirgaceae bacterium BMA10]|uniref:histidine kinase n=1 Tax=Splendidivirga corallicola TaxID=3051826 RepID=A0ABT8KN13_9BACT|nr:PAS domain S-box protein [Fulvivirgaceae bacterium BMA10]
MKMKLVFVLSLFVLVSIDGNCRAYLVPTESLDGDSLLQKNIDVNNRIARHFLSHEPNLAFSYADSASRKAIQMNYQEGLLESLFIKGEIKEIQGDYERSLLHYSQGIKLANELGNTSRAMLGQVKAGYIYLELNDLKGAELTFSTALKSPSIEEDPELHAAVYTGLWKLYWSRGNTDTVAQFQQKVLQIFEENKDNVNVSNKIASNFLKVNDFEAALEYFEKTLEFLREKGNKRELANTLESIGEIYLIKEMGNWSLSYFEEAIALYEVLNDKPALIEAHLNIGRAYRLIGDFKKSIENVNEGLKIARYINGNSYMASSLQLLSEVHEEYGQHDIALKYYKDYTALRDTIFSRENANRIAELSANFELDQKSQEIEKLKAIKERMDEKARYTEQIDGLRGNLLVALTVTTALIFFIASLLFNRYRAKQMANKILEKQFTEISLQKAEIEAKSEIINDKNAQLEKAHKIIASQNKKFRDANEHLEELVAERTNELKRTFNKLSFHVDNTPLAVMEWDNKLRLIRWSSQAEMIFGWASEEVLGKSIKELPLMKGEGESFIDDFFKGLFKGEKPRNFFQRKSQNKKGDLLDIEWSNSILYDENGELQSILTIANDVTLREKALFDLRVSNKELDNFIYRASHDLRGPIARLQGVINLGLVEAKDDLSQKYFDLLGKITFEMNAILLRLLAIHEVYQHQFKLTKVNVKKTVDLVIKEFKDKNYAFDINVNNLVQENIHWKTDFRLLKLIVQNLIENAFVNGMAKEGYVNIQADILEKRNLKLVFTDNGLGFPEEITDRIFDLFFPVSENSNVAAGLGLHMVKKCVERLQGNIKLVRPVDDTIFEIVLPNIDKNETIELIQEKYWIEK